MCSTKSGSTYKVASIKVRQYLQSILYKGQAALAKCTILYIGRAAHTMWPVQRSGSTYKVYCTKRSGSTYKVRDTKIREFLQNVR
jgi:hypothetical protein